MCGDRLKDKQEDRRMLIRIKWTCSFLNNPHHYYLPFPCFHLNAKHISIYSTLWNMTQYLTILYPVAWSYVRINNTTMITIKKSRRKSEIKKYNDELNILQEGQQFTVDPVSLHYKQNMNSNIFETQYKQLQAQGYYLLFNMFCSGKYANTLQTESLDFFLN